MAIEFMNYFFFLHHITLKFVGTKDQWANIFIKPLMKIVLLKLEEN